MRSNASDPRPNEGGLPLSLLSHGDQAVVVEVRGGHGMRRRFADMGLLPGARIEVCSDVNSAGPVIVRVLDARIAIGRGMAPRIMVRPL